MPQRRVVYTGMPEGMGANPSGKPERVSAPPCRASTCFANMRSAADLPLSPASHDEMTRRIVAAGKIRSSQRSESEYGSDYVPPRQVVARAEKRNSFARGTKVRDVNTGRKGVIIQASAGHTKKTKTPVHRVSDKYGNSWLARQDDLITLR